MKKSALLVIVFIALFTVSCANQPLVNNYKGDVFVGVLQVDFAPIRDPEHSLSGDFSKITNVIKGVQELVELAEPTQREGLVNQLHSFEKIVTKGIRERSGVPLRLAKDSEFNTQYGDNNELVNIEFDYPISRIFYRRIFLKPHDRT